ncbi:hypothetical protein MKW98_016395 [Papaver atlanticum]|uniref:Uncharacterized protein n=1 Tax=Papaver atlanticum TaxID=357466 RepID=A0AAD4XEW0_9MAGN|nr:hypothetical protein MKW98_016395 [Papaver atlanticum]
MSSWFGNTRNRLLIHKSPWKFAPPIETLTESLGYMEYFQNQHQVLVKPLSTRKKELPVKVMKQVCSQDPTSTTFLRGNPPLVCPPSPSDTPPPRSISIHSINHFEDLNYESKKPAKETTRKSLKISPLSWKFQKWASSTATQKSTPQSETKLINPTQIKLSRGNCIKQDPDDSVSLLIPIRFCSMAIILNGWTTTLSLQTYVYDLSDVHGLTINGDIIKLYHCISSASTRFYTALGHSSMPRGIGGIMEIKVKEFKVTNVKTGDAIIEGTKAVCCQWDKMERRTDSILWKVYLQMGFKIHSTPETILHQLASTTTCTYAILSFSAK